MKIDLSSRGVAAKVAPVIGDRLVRAGGEVGVIRTISDNIHGAVFVVDIGMGEAMRTAVWLEREIVAAYITVRVRS